MPKVLLIEDDRETAQEIAAELLQRGFDVEWAGTGIKVRTKRGPPTPMR